MLEDSLQLFCRNQVKNKTNCVEIISSVRCGSQWDFPFLLSFVSYWMRRGSETDGICLKALNYH